MATKETTTKKGATAAADKGTTTAAESKGAAAKKAPEATAANAGNNELVTRGELFNVPLSKIEVLKGFNEREDYGDMEELTAQIIAEGVKVPGVAYVNPKNGKYVIVEGHRRRLAIELAAAKGHPGIKMPLVLEAKESSEADRKMLQLTTGAGVKPLTMLEQGKVIKALVTMGLTTGEIARRRGVSPAAIDNLLILTDLSPATQQHIKEGTLAPSLAIDTVRSTGDTKTAEAALLPLAEKAKGEGGTVKRNEVPVVDKKIAISQIGNLVTGLEENYKHVRDEHPTAKLMFETALETLEKLQKYFKGELRLIDWFGARPTMLEPGSKEYKKEAARVAREKAKADKKGDGTAEAAPAAAKGKGKGKTTETPAATGKAKGKGKAADKATTTPPAELGAAPAPKGKGKGALAKAATEDEAPEGKIIPLNSTQGPTAPQDEAPEAPEVDKAEAPAASAE